MRKVYSELREKWAQVESVETTPDDRMPPLNMLAVLTQDTVFREWQEWQKLPLVEKRSRWKAHLREIDESSIQPQSEFLTLLQTPAINMPSAAIAKTLS
jgi:hypothetical protein